MKKNLKPYTLSLKSLSAFTLIELVLAMGLFVLLISIAVTSYIKVLRTQRAVVAYMEVNDNVSYTLEQMSREIRTGNSFEYISEGLRFVNAYGEIVDYYKSGDSLNRLVNGGMGEKITADNVKINSFNVLLLDNNPMRITVNMSVSSVSSYLKDVSTNIQNTISQRDYAP